MPKRIASLLASGTEILHSLGLKDRVVAISHECDFPPELLHLPRVTSAAIDASRSSAEIDVEVRQRSLQGLPLYRIDVDRLCELAPDLIVTQAQCEVCAVSYSEVIKAIAGRPQLRNSQVVSLQPTTLDGIYHDVQAVADAADVSENGTKVVSRLRDRVESIRRETQTIPASKRPRVACIEWISPLMLAGNWTPNLIELAGGQSPVRAGEHSGYGSWDELSRYGPEVVVIIPCGFDLDRAEAESRILDAVPQWPDLPAVKSGRVFLADGNAYFNRSGPRIIDSLEILAGLIHPEKFGAFQEKYQHAWKPRA